MNSKNENLVAGLNPASFVKEVDGKKIALFALKNKFGMEVAITNYGATVVAVSVADRDGNFDDVVLGFDNIEDYINGNDPYMGAVMGRFGNRIAKGKFELDGKEYTLAINNGPNALHGGLKGFDKVVWTANQLDEQTVELTYVSSDMEEGYPGELTVKVTYRVTDDNEFIIEYEANTDKKTILNLTNHSYFNLKGQGKGDVLDHEMMINAKAYTPSDETSIPFGEIKEVADTPMDFTTPKAIGKDINDDFDQLIWGHGYDHNYVLNKPEGELGLVAVTYDDTTGRMMETCTTEPGVQFYSANWLGGLKGKGGVAYENQTAFCLECQHYPDSPNQPDFPTVILNPEDTYTQITVYKFSVK